MRDVHDRGVVVHTDGFFELWQQPRDGCLEGLAHALEQAVLATGVEVAQAAQGVGIEEFPARRQGRHGGRRRGLLRSRRWRIRHSGIEGVRALVVASGLAGENIGEYDVGFKLAPRLNLRHAPELHFSLDASRDDAMRLDAVLREVGEELKSAAATPAPDEKPAPDGTG